MMLTVRGNEPCFEGSRIRVSYKSTEDRVVLTPGDPGPGKEELELIMWWEGGTWILTPTVPLSVLAFGHIITFPLPN
jgi:hypothetical protein